MKPFRAIYTPTGYVDRKANEAHARTVLVIKVGVDEDDGWAIFIDGDNTLKVGLLKCFTNCYSTEWGEYE